MDVKVKQDFPATWSAQILTAPPLIAPARQFVYPQRVAGEEDALGRGALLLLVKPAHGGTFLATCALGYRDPSAASGVWATPGPNAMLAIAGGYAYRINTLEPETCEFLPLRPVVRVMPTQDLLLLGGLHNVAAVGANGMLWQSERLSWEGVTLGEVRNGTLHGSGWNMHTDRDVPFTLDLATGKHEGGGFTP